MISVRRQDIIKVHKWGSRWTNWVELTATPEILGQFETLEALGFISKQIFGDATYYRIDKATIRIKRERPTSISLPEYLTDIVD